MKNKLILILAIVFALLASFGAYQYMQSLKETYRESGNYSKIAVAKKHIPAKTPINEQMLEFKEVPADYILPGSVMEPEDALGKMSRTDIYAGEQILQKKLIGKDDPDGGLSSKIEEGKRGVTIPVDNVSAVAGLVTPGDKVDVAVTMSQDNDTVTATVLYKLPVIAINQTTSTGKEKFEPGTATLMATPEQAQRLILADETGSIRFLLRSPEDDSTPGISPSGRNELIR